MLDSDEDGCTRDENRRTRNEIAYFTKRLFFLQPGDADDKPKLSKKKMKKLHRLSVAELKQV